MGKILGLDLGTNSIGWAMVDTQDDINERSSIIKLGVRVNPLTVDEQSNFEKGKSITTNADRTLKRSMRRNLQRFKLRRDALVDLFKEAGMITPDTLLSEHGNRSTFETLSLRAKCATEEIALTEFARVLLNINKKRGYKSSRKAKNQEDGQLVDGMEVAKRLYDDGLTPGQYVLELLEAGKRYIPEFYRSDLQTELNKIWSHQMEYYPELLTNAFREQVENCKGKLNTSKLFLAKYGIYTAENKGAERRIQSYRWRVNGISEQLTKEELAFVISDLNGIIANSSGYLGAISDRSKELFFNKQTVGQYQMAQLEKDPHYSLKNQVFYRQDYLDEFNTIWETQAKFHPLLTAELKHEVRDIVIFYQRRLKSQKGLVRFCEFENKQIDLVVDGKKKKKTVGCKVCPKSSPAFQEFKIWQILNDILITERANGAKRGLEQEEKELLFSELRFKAQLSKNDVLKLLFGSGVKFDLNFKDIQGNRTLAEIIRVCQTIVELSGHGEYDFSKMRAQEIEHIVIPVFEGLGYNTDILYFNSDLENPDFERQPLYKLWHLLYSFEGDNSTTGNKKLIEKIREITGLEAEYAAMLSNISLQEDYAELSTKAIRKILTYLKVGNNYALSCEYAGYRHSKSSLTKEEIACKVLKDKLEILPRNSLRNPVVEKILNQMVHVVNTAIERYGKPDEIHIELARELKKSAKEREETTTEIRSKTAEHEKYREILRKEFGLTYVSRNDIIRYRLYLELASRGYKTLYSDTYIPREMLFSKEFDIEHIIPQAKLFDDSFSNKTLESRSVNIEKSNATAYDYILTKSGQSGLDSYLLKIEELYKSKAITRGKYNKLKMKEADIPSDFINRDLRDSQYIAKKAKTMLEELVQTVVSTTGSVTSRLREDWQLVDVMKELNWDKYDKLGLTEITYNRDGQGIRQIKDWTKRNDHRHHAMDALTVAFTKLSHIQYLNNLNARSDKSGAIYGIECKELYRDDRNKLRFNPPMPLSAFRKEAKQHLENTLISIKAKNKVVTRNVNRTKTKHGHNERILEYLTLPAQ